MEEINVRGLIFGGLFSGFVLNVGEFILNQLVLGTEWLTLSAALDLPTFPTVTIILFAIATFAVGIILLWIYAASRAFFSHKRSAILIASLSIWFLIHFFPCLWISGLGIIPNRLLVISVIWGLGEVVLAGLVGAWYHNRMVEGS